MKIKPRLLLFLGVISAFSIPGFSAAVAPCNANFTACSISENILYQLPFIAIAGDEVILEPSSSVVSDVFRIFNDVIDTGGGTGLGQTVFLYSVDNGPLPDPSTYSLNFQAIHEAVTGFTSFNGNGTVYTLDTPEPSTFGLLGLGVIAMLFLSRKRGRRCPSRG
jgi:hypothetical protein